MLGADEAEARRTAHRIWPQRAAARRARAGPADPGHFEQASELVTEEMVAERVPCGPDIERHVESLQQYADAGVDELYVQQIGGGDEEFFASTRARCCRASSHEQIRIGVQVQPQHAPYDAMRRGSAELDELGADMASPGTTPSR